MYAMESGVHVCVTVSKNKARVSAPQQCATCGSRLDQSTDHFFPSARCNCQETCEHMYTHHISRGCSIFQATVKRIACGGPPTLSFFCIFRGSLQTSLGNSLVVCVHIQHPRMVAGCVTLSSGLSWIVCSIACETWYWNGIRVQNAGGQQMANVVEHCGIAGCVGVDVSLVSEVKGAFCAGRRGKGVSNKWRKMCSVTNRCDDLGLGLGLEMVTMLVANQG